LGSHLSNFPGNSERLHTLKDIPQGLVPRSSMPEYGPSETRSTLGAAIWFLMLAVFVALIGAAFYLLAL